VTETLYPDWLHAIVGLRGRRATCSIYRISDGNVTRLSVTWADLPPRLP